MQYTEIFSAVKIEKIHQKKKDIFLIFAQNIDCVYSLEPPRRGGSNEYSQSMFCSKVYPCKPQLFYVIVGCKGVYIIWICFRNG